MPKTLGNFLVRWRGMGVLARIVEGLASGGGADKAVMIDPTRLKAHRTASSLRVSAAAEAPIRWTDVPPNGDPTTTSGS